MTVIPYLFHYEQDPAYIATPLKSPVPPPYNTQIAQPKKQTVSSVHNERQIQTQTQHKQAQNGNRNQMQLGRIFGYFRPCEIPQILLDALRDPIHQVELKLENSEKQAYTIRKTNAISLDDEEYGLNIPKDLTWTSKFHNVGDYTQPDVTIALVMAINEQVKFKRGKILDLSRGGFGQALYDNRQTLVPWPKTEYAKADFWTMENLPNACSHFKNSIDVLCIEAALSSRKVQLESWKSALILAAHSLTQDGELLLTIPAISDLEQYTLLRITLGSFRTVRMIAALSLHPRQRLLICQGFHMTDSHRIKEAFETKVESGEHLICEESEGDGQTKIMFANIRATEKLSFWHGLKFDTNIMQEACRSILRIKRPSAK